MVERAQGGSSFQQLPRLQPQQLRPAQPQLQLKLSSSSALEHLCVGAMASEPPCIRAQNGISQGSYCNILNLYQ